MVSSKRNESLLHVRLFGGPLLFRGGEVIPLSAYQSALLSVVFGAGARGMTRVDVTRLLWSDGDERARRRRLSQLLYSLTQRAPPGPIAAEGERIRPDFEVTSSDLGEYEESLREDELAGASSLSESEFLAGLSEEVTDALGDWLRAKRLRLRGDLRHRASAVWSEATREARWPQALNAAEVLLRIDPLDQESLKKVILARAMLGQMAEARAVRQAFEEHFRAEVGEWTPDTETQGLLDRIEVFALEEQDRSEDETLAPEPPFCGRQKELAALTREVLIGEEDGLVLVTVRGEGGMGKTRLVEEALKATHFRGIRVLTARSSEFERDIPLNPILEALTRAEVGEVVRSLEDPWRRVLLSLMPELHEGPAPLPEIPNIGPGSVPRRLFEAIRQAFLALAEQGPLVLFLDDFHWADDTSIAVLEYLRRRWDGGGLCVVLALRPEDLARGGAAARFVSALEPLEEAWDVELGDLEEEAVELLIAELAAGNLTPEQAGRIAALSGNHPFFIVELTMEALAGRKIPGGKGLDATPVPVSIRQLLAHRLGGLSPSAEQLLGLLVAIGRPLPDDEVQRLSRLRGEAFVTSIEELQDLRLVRRPDELGICVRHELIRQTVYGRLSEARRRFIHDRIARFLLRFRSPPPVDELALHFDRASARDNAFKYAVEAAKAAESAGAIPEALRFLTVARRNTDDEATSTEILWQLSHLHYLHRNLSEAAPLLELAARRLRGQDRISESLEAEAKKLDALASLGSVSEEDVLAEICRTKDTAIQGQHWGVVATLLDTAVHIYHRSNNFTAIAECLQEMESYLDHGTEEDRCLMLSSLVAHVFYGIPGKGIDFARAAMNIAETLGRNDLWLKAVNRYLFATIIQGVFNAENCISLIRQAQQDARLSGDLMGRYRLHSNLGVWYIDTGEYDQALEEFKNARTLLQSTEAIHARLNIHYNLGEVYYFLSDVSRAKEHFLRALEFLTPATPTYYHDLLDAGLGLCALYNGHLSEASHKDQTIHVNYTHWNFNPYLLVIFKAEMLLRRHRWRDALSLLDDQSLKLSYRFPVPALRLKRRVWEILSKLDLDSDRRKNIREDICKIAQERQLGAIARQF